MLKYDNTVSSTVDGKPIYGAQVNVYDGSGAPASIYADATGTMPASQPVLTDQLGYFSFYIPDGLYEVRVQTGTIEISRTNITMVDTLGLKTRALLVPVNEDAGTLPSAGQRLGTVLGFDAVNGDPTIFPPSDFAGPTGPADNTYSSYSEMQLSDPTRASARLVGDTDVPPHPDGPYNNPTQTVNGWVPQGADGIAYAQPLARAIDESTASPLDTIPSIYSYIPRSLHAAIRAGTDPTDHTPYLQKMIDDGLSIIRCPRGHFNGKSALNVTHNIHFQCDGRDATIFNIDYNGYWIEVTQSNRRVSAVDATFNGNLAKPNSGLFKLFDPATYPFIRCNFNGFNREALCYVQGVQCTAEGCTWVNCGNEKSSPVTIANGAPGIISWPNHGLAAGTRVVLTTTNMLPDGLTPRYVYFVVNPTADGFSLSTRVNGSAAATSGSQAGEHTAYAAPYAAIRFDPGATASPRMTLLNCYVAASGMGLSATSARSVAIIATTFESNVIAVDLSSCDGNQESAYYEANLVSINLLDSPGFDEGDWIGDGPVQRAYIDVGGDQRRARISVAAHGEMYNKDDRSGFGPDGTGQPQWVFLQLSTVGVYLNCTPNSAGDSRFIRADRPGDYKIDYMALLRTITADAGAGSIRVVADKSDGNFVEVEGSRLVLSLLGNDTKQLSGCKTFAAVAMTRFGIQVSTSTANVWVSSTGPAGLAASSYMTNASLRITHMGTIG